MIINYSVTQQGLQEQLLNVTVSHERPDLEEQRERLVKEMSDSKSLLKQLEDTLLRELSQATGEILDNTALIETLENTKKKAVEIAENLKEAQVTAKEIDTTRVKYVPVAKRGSILFFVMSSLSVINTMYENSLFMYLEVFNLTLATSKKDSNLENRLRNVVEALTYDVYNFTCLGLFERHKLMLSFQMTIKIQEGEVASTANSSTSSSRATSASRSPSAKSPTTGGPTRAGRTSWPSSTYAATIPTPSRRVPEEAEQVNRVSQEPRV